MCFGIIGFEQNSLLIIFDSLGALPLIPETIGQIVVGFCKIRFNTYCLLEICDRFGELLPVFQGNAQVAVNLSVVGIDFKRPPVILNRLGGPALIRRRSSTGEIGWRIRASK